MKRPVCAPPVEGEIPIQSQDLSGPQLRHQVDQERVGEIYFVVAILSQDTLNRGGATAQRNRDLKGAAGHILQNGLGRPCEASRQVASLRDHGFAGNQRRVNLIQSADAFAMAVFASVERGDNDARIQQDRFQAPNPLRCLLLDPRSRTPEENLPSPVMRGRAGKGYDAARRRSASRTTREGLQPRLRTSCSRSRRLDGSSRACTVDPIATVYYRVDAV
jgi:hypothetical protein